MTDEDAPRAACDFARFPAGRDLELLYFPGTRTTLTVSSQAAALLQQCRGFATPAEHAARAARAFRLGEARAPALARQLALFVAAGVMPTRAEWRARHAGPADEAPGAPIDVLGVPTRDRPRQLVAAVASYVLNARAFGRSPEVVVCDDSRTPETRRDTREALRAFARGEGLNVRCADRESRAAYALDLARECGLDPEAARFALLDPEDCGASHGAARNTLLLDTPGETCVLVDDDTLCRLARVPGAGDGLALSSADDPTEFHFFDSEAAALSAAPFAEADFLGLHAELLGRDGRGLAGRAGDGLAVDAPDADLERALRAASPRVVATSLGVVGDSGMASPLACLLAEGGSRARLLASERAYRGALFSRQVLRGVVRTTLSNGTFCMSTCLGLDHRGLLPPFFPVQRNEDGVFAIVLRACFRAALRGFQPWALRHAPEPARRFDPGEVWRLAPRLGTGDLVGLLAGAFGAWPRGERDADNLAALGRFLSDLAAQPAADFEESLRLHAWRWASARLARLERALREFPDAPGYWSDDLRRWLDLWRRGLPERALIVPHDLEAARGPDGALALLQRLVGRFGVVLCHWADLRAAAVTLRARGTRPSVPLDPG